jgi:hypothetical protein
VNFRVNGFEEADQIERLIVVARAALWAAARRWQDTGRTY